MSDWTQVYGAVGAGFGFGSGLRHKAAHYAEIFAGRRFVAVNDSGKWIFNREAARDTTAIEQEFSMLALLAGDAGIVISTADHGSSSDTGEGNDLFDFAPRMLQSADGKPYVSVDGGLWTARNYLEAEETFDWRNVSWRENHCFLAGQTLARFHRWGSKIKAASPSKLTCLKPEVDYEEVCIGRLYPHLADQSAAAQEHLLSLLHKALNAAGKTAPSCSPIHGDFHPGNVLFSKGSVRAVIDWDFSRLGDFLFDLAYARLMFAGKFRGFKNQPRKEPSKTKQSKKEQSVAFNVAPDLEALFDWHLLAAFENGYFSRQFEGASAGLRQVCPLPVAPPSKSLLESFAKEQDLALALRARTVLSMALILAFEMEEFKSQSYTAAVRANRAAIIANLFAHFAALETFA